MDKIIRIRRLTPSPEIISKGDHKVVLKFRAKSLEGDWTAKISVIIDTENPDVFILTDGTPSKHFLFALELTEKWQNVEQEVSLRVKKKPTTPTPFGIMVSRKNPDQISYSEYIMVYS